MRVDLNARVRTRDGEDAGSVQHAVIDPETNEVTGFVVSTGGLLGRSVIVPREDLERASRDGEVLLLDLTKEQMGDLRAYEPSDYGVPPYGWMPPAAYTYPVGGYLWPVTHSYAQAPADASTGWTTPPGARAGGDGDYTVDKGAIVLDRDGDDVGVVEDVYLEPTGGRLRGVVVRVGGALQTLFGGGETVEVMGRMVDRVSGGVVHLRVTKEELRRVG